MEDYLDMYLQNNHTEPRILLEFQVKYSSAK